MTEAPCGGTRAKMERRIIEKSLKDESFRQSLLANPTAVLDVASHGRPATGTSLEQIAVRLNLRCIKATGIRSIS